ncbi:MAG: dihydroxyacetone kinase phosphoryl donor subunit DhaM [Bacillota bacterium]
MPLLGAVSMVSLVIVSHSAKLAEGVRELVEQVTRGRVNVLTAGAVDATTLGTTPDSVRTALDRAQASEGTLVLVDLGSAIITTEMVLEELPSDRRARVLLCEAPLVEGAVAAAAQIAAGATLEEAAAEARGALAPKLVQLGVGGCGDPALTGGVIPDVETVVTVSHPLGLHAMAAAAFVRMASQFQATVWVRSLTRNTCTVNAKSLNALSQLDVRKGHVIAIAASGSDSSLAVAKLKALVESGFAEGDLPGGRRETPRGRARLYPGRSSRSMGRPVLGDARLAGHGAARNPVSLRKPTGEGLYQRQHRSIGVTATRAVLDAMAYVREHYADPITTRAIARSVFLQPQYFCRVFKAYTGIPFMTYVTNVRVAKAKELLARTGLSIAEVAFEVGYRDPNYFARVFRRVQGISPRAYRRLFSEGGPGSG